MPGGSHRRTRKGRGWVMTRSDDLRAVAAALARLDAALDRCLALIHQRQPPPPTGAGLVRRADPRPHQEPNHG